MFGACQRKASCCAKKKIVALSIVTVLLSRRLLEISGIVMKDIIQDADFEKSRLLNKKIFIQMRSGFGSEYTHLLYHSEFGKRNFLVRSGRLRTKTWLVKKIMCTNKAPIMDFEVHNLTNLNINGLIRQHVCTFRMCLVANLLPPWPSSVNR
jgi:hypothetical protein